MAITRKRRVENEDEDQNLGHPMAQVFDDVDNEDGDQITEKDEQYEKLATQMADLQKRLEEQSRLNMALMQQPQKWQSQTDTYVEQDPNKIPLPDPALDPDGFSAAQIKRADVAAENRRQREDRSRRQQEDIDKKVDNLWSAFGEAYPDYDGDKRKTEFVATQVLQRAKAKGLDVERYMFLNQDTFLADVAKEYDDVFGSPIDDEEYEDRRPAARAKPRRRTDNRRRRDDDDDGRSASIFGGQESSGRHTRRNEDDNGPGNMIDDLQIAQKKSGFF